MGWGIGYVRNAVIMQGADLSEIKEGTVKRSKRYYNTMSFEDTQGNTRFRIADTWRSGCDAVLIHKSGSYAKVYWHRGVDRGFLWKIGQIVRDHFGYERYGLSISHFNMRDSRVHVNLDTGIPDLSESRGNYRSSVHLEFIGYPGMAIPSNKRIDYLQGFRDPWNVRGQADDLCKKIFKKGVAIHRGRRDEKVQITKWNEVPSCPDCRREMQILLDACQQYEDDMFLYRKGKFTKGREEDEEDNAIEKPKSIYTRLEELENTTFCHFMARPFATTQSGELPFSHYAEESQFPTDNDHIIAHIETGTVTPEMVMCAAILHNSHNWKSVGEMVEVDGKQVLSIKWNSINTLRWVVRHYLLKRIGLPTWRY